jgi:hypothetical protein
MASGLNSYLGFALQTAKDTEATSGFKYVPFREGQVSPNNIIIPLDMESGGGSLVRGVKKVGVSGGGMVSIIPRPDSLGLFLYGVLGTKAVAGDGASTPYTHTFTMVPGGAGEFGTPYFTVRSTPGSLWGEVVVNNRLTGLSLEFRAPDFVRGTLAWLGTTPKMASPAAWNPAAALDVTPPFITPVGQLAIDTVEYPVLAGALTTALAIPMDQQYTVGNYYPDDVDVVSRAVMINMTVKVANDTLYRKLQYDPQAGDDWAAETFQSGAFTLNFQTPENIPGVTPAAPYSIDIQGNGQDAASGDGNLVWTAAPIGSRPGQQIVMNVTGTFIADPRGGANIPVTVELQNGTASYAGS